MAKANEVLYSGDGQMAEVPAAPIITRERIREMLNSEIEKRIHIVGRALVALFERQTESEKHANTTNDLNSRGFAGSDAKPGSIAAKYYLKRGTLLDWQLERWTKVGANGFPKLAKYHRQLNEIAVAKAQRRESAEISKRLA